MEKYVVVYYDRYNSKVTESQVFDTFEDAETQKTTGKPDGFTNVVYAKIDKRYYY